MPSICSTWYHRGSMPTTKNKTSNKQKGERNKVRKERRRSVHLIPLHTRADTKLRCTTRTVLHLQSYSKHRCAWMFCFYEVLNASPCQVTKVAQTANKEDLRNCQSVKGCVRACACDVASVGFAVGVWQSAVCVACCEECPLQFAGVRAETTVPVNTRARTAEEQAQERKQSAWWSWKDDACLVIWNETKLATEKAFVREEEIR